MKDIVFITEYLGGGGSERVIAQLANKLCSEREYRVSIALLSEQTEKEYFVDSRVQIYRLPQMYKITEKKNNHKWFKKKLSNISLLADRFLLSEIDRTKTYLLDRFFDEHYCDCAVSFLVIPNIALLRSSRQRNFRVVISERNYPKSYKISEALENIRRKHYHGYDCLVCQTPEILSMFSCDASSNSYAVIENAVSSDISEPYHGKRKKIITNFCGLKPQKNLPLLIEAFSIFHTDHNDYKLIIYGDGDRREADNKIRELNIADFVEIKPFEKNIHEVIKDYAMFVSSSDFEGISNSLLEAMALGMPVISTDSDGGGARILIQDGINGIIVPKRDSQAMADAMRKIADNEIFANELSLNAENVREMFSLARIIEKWRNVL